MIKRNIEISSEPAHLAVENDQLLILREGETKRSVQGRARIPCEDIGIIIVDQRAVSYSHHALATLVAHGAAVVICGRDHLPVGLLLPLSGHAEVVSRLHDQIAMGAVLRKRLWTQIVVAKVRAQAANLDDSDPSRAKLLALAHRVRSGDPENIEAQAACIYWPRLFDKASEAPFRRRPGVRVPPNDFLDYGYAILRAAVARTLVGAGFNTALGIHHSNRSNAFCLADDLLEPLRPMVDRRVRHLLATGSKALDRDSKSHLLNTTVESVFIGQTSGPLLVALSRYAASLGRCLRGETDSLDIPCSGAEGVGSG